MSHNKATGEQPQRNELSSQTDAKSVYSAPKLTMFGSVAELTLAGAAGSPEGMAMIAPLKFG